jgi:hypothetical protein
MVAVVVEKKVGGFQKLGKTLKLPAKRAATPS